MAKDAYHEVVKRALEKDGWQVTHDPLPIIFEGLRVAADLGAERVLAAERATDKIAVEIKVFGGKSKISEFEKALGQYDLYELYLSELEPRRILFLAVSDESYEKFLKLPAIYFAVTRKKLKLIIFNIAAEEIIEWIS